MKLSDRIPVFVSLGKKIEKLNEDELTPLIQRASVQNPWFTEESIRNAYQGICHMLKADRLEEWLSSYHLHPEVPKMVGLVMAGNIPLVGFHDLLCVLLSGHVAAVKMSSQDEVLTQQMIDWIEEIEPQFKRMITQPEKLTDIDAIIATGSDNTARYFEYYFGKYPGIIRKNRTSIAVLNGSETEQELTKLGKDVFDYFGLGCRNVSKLMIPRSFDIKLLLSLWEKYGDIIYHNKYRNNYDYHKSILLVNKTKHLDTGFSLFTESSDLVSPTSVIYYQYYSNKKDLLTYLSEQSDKIQCIISNEPVPKKVAFGKAQRPDPWDYADGVDTLRFLDNI